jgi:ABC-type Fe3+-citrate transport system substrate-binding protein
MNLYEYEDKINKLQKELSFAHAELDLIGVSRQRMMQRTVQASFQRDLLIESIRDAIRTKDYSPLESMLTAVDCKDGLWKPHTTTDRKDNYKAKTSDSRK